MSKWDNLPKRYVFENSICLMLIKIAEICIFIKGINHNRFRGYA